MRRCYLINTGARPVEYKEGNFIDPPAKNDVAEKYKQLLDIIYSVNPQVGYPQGDLAVWLSENASKEVRDFVEQNLIHQDAPSSPVEMSTSLLNELRTKITDDDVAAFARKRGESSDDYAARMYQHLGNIKYNEQVKRETARLKAIVDADSKAGK